MTRSAYPPLLATCRPLFGQSLIGKADDLALMEQFAQPGAIESWLEAMVDAGVRSLVAPMDERILSVLRRRRDLGIEVIPLMPNVTGLVREATEYGMMGAGVRLVWRLGIGTMIRLGVRSIPLAPGVLKRDFPTMLSVLFDLELNLFRTLRPQRALMHPQITDLLLAMGSHAFFARYAKTLRARFAIEPGVATNNLGTLAQRFKDWGTDIQLIMTPVNREGWAMKPGRDACESALGNEKLQVIAERVTTEPPPSPESLAYAARFPAVRELALDVADWKLFREKALTTP